MDAYNIDRLIKQNPKKNPNTVIYDYYDGVNSGNVNRSKMFTEFWGKGNSNKGIKKLEKVVDGWSLGKPVLNRHDIIKDINDSIYISTLSSNGMWMPKHRDYVVEEAMKRDTEKEKRTVKKKNAREDFFNYLYSDLGLK